MKSNQINQGRVLMYHGIIDHDAAPAPNREEGAQLYDVAAKDFREQLSWLKENKFQVKTLNEQQSLLLPNEVVITFDDGEMNNFTKAFPILKEFGYPGYFFMIVRRIGKPGYMDWQELKALQDAGMVIGSHGLSHEILTNLLDTQIEEELLSSKRNLEWNLKSTIDTLSIPRGFCNDKIIQMAYSIGYKKIFISDRPANFTSECFVRMAVKGSWSLKDFQKVFLGRLSIFDQMFGFMKRSAKLILRERGYNALRSLIIKLFK